jgi:hypothetical protein
MQVKIVFALDTTAGIISVKEREMEQKNIQEIKGDIEAQLVHIREPLFTSKSAPDPDWYLNARLHVTPENWDTYAEGYRSAADIIVQYVIDNNWYQDFLVYPIVFLYRQYLELRLKELIRVSSQLLGQKPDFPKEHDLVKLWRKVRPNIGQVWPDSMTESYLEATEDRIKELYSIDPGSYAFRYPEDKKGTPTLLGRQHINLKQLRDVVKAISIVLDGSSIGMGEYLNAKHEMMAEYRTEIDS